MHLRYSFRIEPTPGQRIALARTFGCARVVYNDALALRKAAWQADRSRIPTGAVGPAGDHAGEADPGAGVARRGVRGRVAVLPA
ncbi:helix-turn-helix domain-containing protein [Streptomyces sp. 900105245]